MAAALGSNESFRGISLTTHYKILSSSLRNCGNERQDTFCSIHIDLQRNFSKWWIFRMMTTVGFPLNEFPAFFS
jgi:hypothetical protein